MKKAQTVVKQTSSKKDVFTLLTKDHDKMRTLFKKLMTGKTKKETFEEIVMILDWHMNFEETYLYPELKGTKANFEALEAEEEHRVGKHIQAELESENQNTDRWLAKAKVLKEVIEHHAKEEEDEFFVKARKILGQEKIEKLANQFIMDKANA